jgi:hypothetical protein
MPRKHHKPEEIVVKLRQVNVLTPQGDQPPETGLELELPRFDGRVGAFRRLARAIMFPFVLELMAAPKG